MKYVFSLLVVCVLMFSSCSERDNKPLVVSTNAWIGFTPLFYAREMGWLKEANIELISVVSLGESTHLFEAGSADAFTATQHEFIKQRESNSDLIPVMLLDRSNGGDAVMANRTIEALQHSGEKIHVYLEIDSINADLLEYFIKEYKISKDRLILNNRIQDEIRLMKNAPELPPTLIVTYDPYNMALLRNGFTELVSTKNKTDLFVVDAMFVSSKTFYTHKQQFQKLNDAVERSINALQKDPKSFYEKVKPYLDNPSYEEFQHMLGNIEWIHEKPSEKMLNRMEEIGFPSKDLMQ